MSATAEQMASLYEGRYNEVVFHADTYFPFCDWGAPPSEFLLIAMIAGWISSLSPHGPGSLRPPNLIPWHIHSITKSQERYTQTPGRVHPWGDCPIPKRRGPAPKRARSWSKYYQERESRPKENTYIEKVSPDLHQSMP